MMSDKKLKTVGIRANEAEVAVLDAFFERIRKRNHYITRSDIFRELIGINPHTITADDRTWLRDQFRKINADEHPGNDVRPLTAGHG